MTSPERGQARTEVASKRVRTYLEQGANKSACDAFFWFLVGYASHVIADGVCHPFVMDKVGRYEGANKAEHRALEMGLDVLLCQHFTGDSGHAIEAGYARMDSSIKGFNELKAADIVCHHFANLIGTVYGVTVRPAEVRGWVAGISRLFCLATGRWPAWLRNLDATRPYVFREIADLDGRATLVAVVAVALFFDFTNGFHDTANVVATSVVPLVYPPAADQSVVARLEDACRKGGTTCFTSGIDPGWANDLVPLALSGACERIDALRVTEILNYATYDQPTVLFETMGFGKPLDHTPLLLVPGVLTLAWGPVVRQLAAGLGVREDVRLGIRCLDLRIESGLEEAPFINDLRPHGAVHQTHRQQGSFP